jgi:hypothetical protein
MGGLPFLYLFPQTINEKNIIICMPVIDWRLWHGSKKGQTCYCK